MISCCISGPRTVWAAAAVNDELCDFSSYHNIVWQFVPTACFCYITNEIKLKTAQEQLQS